jgi:hypothetical protein
MKTVRIFALCLCAALLWGCQSPVTPPTTTTPTTAPTTIPTEPTVPPTTEPPAPQWLVSDRISPSYDDFFTQDLSYNTITYGWTITEGDSLAQYYIRNEGDGLYISTNRWSGGYKIPNSENLMELPIVGADGKWTYLHSSEGILQLDMQTGESTLLVAHGSILRSALCGYDVLYYAAIAENDTIGIYRLYIPTMTTDTLCEGIANGYDLDIRFPSTTLGTVSWSCINPDMAQRLFAELNDPNSPYLEGDEQGEGPKHLWEDPSILQDPSYDWGWDKAALWVCRWIQEDTGIHTWYKCTYDPNTDTYTEDTGVVDNCWFGSGYAHDHFEPEITSLPDPTPAIGPWIPITGATLPASPTAEELYTEGLYDHYDANIPEVIVYGLPLQPEYAYHLRGSTLTKAVDIPITMAQNSVHFLYCVTEDNTVLQISHDGSSRNVLYTAEAEIREISQANGHLYILDGSKIIDIDVPALQYRVLLEHDYIIEASAQDEPGIVYFTIARGLHYQQYLFNPETGELERTHIL